MTTTKKPYIREKSNYRCSQKKSWWRQIEQLAHERGAYAQVQSAASGTRRPCLQQATRGSITVMLASQQLRYGIS